MPPATGDADPTDRPEPGPEAPSAPRVPRDLRETFVAVGDPPRGALLRASFRREFRRLDLIRSAEPGWRPPRREGDGPGDGGERGRAGGAADVPGMAGGGGGAADVPGRGPIHVVPLDGGGQAVVRPFRRGGLVRHLVEARYFLGDRAFHELALLARLRRRDLPVPRPLAAVQSRRIPGYRAALVTRRIAGVEPLSRLLPGSPPDRTRRLMEAVGRTVGRLHAVGAAHADLNAHNLLADPEASDRPVYLVDLDRGRLGDTPLPERAARGNLRRLRRSLEKLSLEGALDHWDGFLRSYRRNREGTAGGSTG